MPTGGPMQWGGGRAAGFSRSDVFMLLLRLALVTVATTVSVRMMVKLLDPTRRQKQKAREKAMGILKRLGIKQNFKVGLLTEYEVMIASQLVEPESITVTWDDIAGLDDVIQELRETVIYPIKKKEICAQSQLTQPPKGVLLHGPPGCGKTLIAKATAKEAGCNFINLDVSSLTDKWYGESQKLAAAVFSLSVKLQPCITFIDEIDSLLRSRESHDHEATAMMKAQFMSLWDGLITDTNCTVIIMGATNRPQDLDRAILRRMAATFHIGMPTLLQRRQILRLVMACENTSPDVDLDRLAKLTETYSGSDLRELCRYAAVHRMRDYFHREGNRSGDGSASQDSLRPITMDDLLRSLSKMKESKAFTGGIVPMLANKAELD